MRVDVIRRGGFAGVALHAMLDTAQLTTTEAGSVEAALRELPWDRPSTGSIEPDRFRYEMVTVEGDHEWRVVLDEREVPDALRPLLALLTDQGQIRPASG